MYVNCNRKKRKKERKKKRKHDMKESNKCLIVSRISHWNSPFNWRLGKRFHFRLLSVHRPMLKSLMKL